MRDVHMKMVVVSDLEKRHLAMVRDRAIGLEMCNPGLQSLDIGCPHFSHQRMSCRDFHSAVPRQISLDMTKEC